VPGFFLTSNLHPEKGEKRTKFYTLLKLSTLITMRKICCIKEAFYLAEDAAGINFIEIEFTQ